MIKYSDVLHLRGKTKDMIIKSGIKLFIWNKILLMVEIQYTNQNIDIWKYGNRFNI